MGAKSTIQEAVADLYSVGNPHVYKGCDYDGTMQKFGSALARWTGLWREGRAVATATTNLGTASPDQGRGTRENVTRLITPWQAGSNPAEPVQRAATETATIALPVRR